MVRSARGARYTAVRPTLAEVVLKMPRGAQVIYPKDLGPILIMADIFPGARVFESGLGSGALSMALLRAGAEITGYELRADFAARAQANVAGFLGAVRARALPRRDPRRLRRHRRYRPRPGGPRPPRAVEDGQGRRGGPAPWRDLRVVPADHRPGVDAAATRWSAAGSAWPRRSRCSNAAGTSRASRCAPTIAWSPTPGFLTSAGLLRPRAVCHLGGAPEPALSRGPPRRRHTPCWS